MHFIIALYPPYAPSQHGINPTPFCAELSKNRLFCPVSRICGTTYTKLANIIFNDLAAILGLFSGESPNLTHPP